MSLTQAQFLTVVDATAPDMVNIWYNDVEPLTVFGVTVPVVDNTGINTIQLLQSAQQLNITINGYNYTFTIVTRAERTATIGGVSVTYYFFDVVDQQIDVLADDISPLYGQVLFVLPGFQGTNFFGSDYDALLNNVEDNRQSTQIMISDRYRVFGGPGSLNPINIDALRTSTADRAQIQDSNYSTTGWINARYDGTRTDSTTYGGVESAITGRPFEGSFYPTTVTNQSILQQISSSLVVYTEYLSNAVTQVPTTTQYVLVRYETVTPSIDITDTQIQIEIKPNEGNQPDLSIGDLIRVVTYAEIMRVNSIQPFGSNLIIGVTRGWNGTQILTIPGDDQPIEKIVGPTKVYQLQGNKVQGIQQGKLLVRDTQQILDIDILGQVVGPSL